MTKLYKWFRAIVMTLVGLAVFVPTAVYIVLSSESVQEKLRQIATEELTKLLGTEVSIGKLGIQPFSRVIIDDVIIDDDFGQEAVFVGQIEARFEFWNFITSGDIVFDHAILTNMRARLYKDTPNSPFNIEGIIEHLKSDDKDKPAQRFDLAIYTVKIDNADIKYDILSIPPNTSRFDINHVDIRDLDLLVSAPKLSNEKISGRIRHLSFTDVSGFEVTNIATDATYTPGRLELDDFVIDLPDSHFDFGSVLLTGDKSHTLDGIFSKTPLDINITKGSYFTLSDFSAFLPIFTNVKRRFDIKSELSLSKSEAVISEINVSEVTDGGFFLNTKGKIEQPFNPDSMSVRNLDFDISAYAPSVIDLLNRSDISVSPKTADAMKRLGKTSVQLSLNGGLADITCVGQILTDLGSISLDGNLCSKDRLRNIVADARLAIVDFHLGELFNNPAIGTFSSLVSGSMKSAQSKHPAFNLSLSDTKGAYNGQVLRDLDANIEMNEDGTFNGRLEAYMEKSLALVTVNGNINDARPRLAGKVSLSHFNPYDLGLIKKYEGYELDVDTDFDLTGKKGEWIDGYIQVSDLMFRSRDFSLPRLHINKFNITANNTVRPNVIDITGDFINGSIQGNVSLFNIAEQSRNIVGPVLPALVGQPLHNPEFQGMRDNDFNFSFVIDNTENIVNFFKFPVSVIYPVTFEGAVNSPEGIMWAGIDAPYLMKGDMLLDQTVVETRIDATQGTADAYVTSHFPTKKGDMTVVGGIQMHDNTLATTVDWEIEREKPINGSLTFDTRFSRDVDTGDLCVEAMIWPCAINFGNDTWRFGKSSLTYKPGFINIDKFSLATDSQSIFIDGVCSKDNPEQEIVIDLKDVVLNTIFETLDINKALIGGIATGTLHAGGIFGDEPFVTCDNLHVQNIGYNNCVLGDGDISAHWDNDRQSFYLDAIVSQPDDKSSHIYGDIFPTREALDLTFEADHVKVGFMKPFMDAFAQDVTGYASGRAHLFGTFKYIDMEGDIFADNLGLKIGFTNTWYYATDSIHVRPGIIDIDNVTVRDAEGHTAKLNGAVKHTFFKDPVFDFKVTDARNFLCYDVPPALSPDWYGKIYGNGSAFINGSPGIVNIEANMATAEGSTFTFVLSDTEEAEQYNFITFRNRDRDVITDSIIQKNILPEAVLDYQERKKAEALMQNPPSVYKMDIQIDITPDAKVILVMDPVGGDEIKSWGKGNLRMTYVSTGNELRMYGSYTIDRGSYNFTLQDIIVKDFTIKEGSSITFTGDPYNATLDIAASYAVNANLSDLDESFINDPELNRTNVPVHALLLVKGDMRQPDIDFDLEFPTLTSDVYRKVRSIVSTDEMMNRQIIYLLALNRFYTPEYMTATKGNELFSVASSTISSRLSSMLGKLSENWSISPNLRSDKGDFSDVQFDVALSSNLLNNRLRMNGNFGYRDKSLNTTQFIGDFDLEYLINRAGTWRLKAYNRFNDQTYFLRTAKTTQGVGIMFQRDFDNMFNFLRHKNPTDTTETK
ncbi:MAG: translocation/assembly module TamB [Muribaculaceae bacterium]|nr:translocation/assembly module TamB [Muribaculaceae bacterium]